MSWFLEPIIRLLYFTANVLPLPAFSFIGSFIEEIIAPIPSLLVMGLAGALAAAKDSNWIYIGTVILMGALGKTLGSIILYFIADKGEDIIWGKFGKFLGISHLEVEAIGKRLNGGWKDGLVIFFLRAIPVMPSGFVSIICGLIKINLRRYTLSTFLGIMVRNVFLFYLGYTGVGAIESINNGIARWEGLGYIILFIIIGAFLINTHRKKGRF